MIQYKKLRTKRFYSHSKQLVKNYPNETQSRESVPERDFFLFFFVIVYIRRNI